MNSCWRKVFKRGIYSRKWSMFDEKYFLTFGDLLTSFLVKNADSRWWIGKSPIGNRTTLVRGCGVDIPYARMKNWKEGEKKKTTMFEITKTVFIQQYFSLFVSQRHNHCPQFFAIWSEPFYLEGPKITMIGYADLVSVNVLSPKGTILRF